MSVARVILIEQRSIGAGFDKLAFLKFVFIFAEKTDYL